MSRPETPVISERKKAFKDAMGTEEGRDTLYDLLLSDGATIEEIANAYGLTKGRLYSVLKDCPEVKAIIDECRAERVADEIYRKAIRHKVERERTYYDKDGNRSGSETVIEHADGDTRSAIFILTNKKGTEWREKQEVRHEVEVGLSDVSFDAFEALRVKYRQEFAEYLKSEQSEQPDTEGHDDRG